MSNVWKKEEIEKLQQMIDANYTKCDIAEALGRTVVAVQIKTNKLGLQIYNTSDNTGNRGRKWTKKDEELLRELWYDSTKSKTVIEKTLRRSWYSISQKAVFMNLGAREYDTEYLSIPTICEEMQVSRDRVKNWLKLGLKTKKNKAGRIKHLINSDDLLEFLGDHQNLFDASLVSEYLFYQEPDWFTQKRREDSIKYASKNRLEYTNEEDKIIVSLFEHGKSDKEIADVLNRTEQGIKYHRLALGLCRNQYTQEEIAILHEYSDVKTVDELCEMLQGRPRKGIMWKCEQLGIPYHISKERCRVDEL